ncbi:MAG: methyltransferase domain-containing protein [Acidobacteria bacterium]|nr:methyltransferase domain-containing protein [Acidobacteriota bacterium]
MKRSASSELLDSDAGNPEEIADALADLRRINRWFGGIATMQALVERVANATGSRELSYLDVAGASGDVPQNVSANLAQKGLRLHVTVLDRLPSHLAAAPNGTRRVAACAASLPFPDDSFDLVGSSLFVHHLSPDEVRITMDECLRACRTAVLINDLRRSWEHLALVHAGFPLYSSRLTRHDAPASVLQAYTPQELRELLRTTKAACVDISHHFLCRMGVIAWKRSRDIA